MSYAHPDDSFGHLTAFRERLSKEVRIQTGDEFPIFQDRNDIQLGQNWKERIEGSLDEVTFLIPILTPSIFTSAACRDELERFLDREKKLNRNDLILPIYFVDYPLLNDAARRASDDLAQELAKRQYDDWRELRFAPISTEPVGKAFARLAVKIRVALERAGMPAKQIAARVGGAPSAAPSLPTRQASRQQPEISEPTGKPDTAAAPFPARTEPLTRVVDPTGGGDHTTITEAIQAAKPGNRIWVRPGLYREGLVIDKPLEILGDGEPGEVVVEVTGKHVVVFQTNMGRLANLTLKQMGGNWFAVDIAQGRPDLEECDITSQSLPCVGIHGGADPRLRRNRIHDGNSAGVVVYENGQGTLEDNDIFGNALAGVEIKTGGNPTLRRNRIHDGKSTGVLVYENGQGTLEDNDIFANATAGVAIKTGGNPSLRRNRIHDGNTVGVYAWENGRGTLEDNDIFGNANAGVTIRKGGNPTLRRNRINKNGYQAVWIYEGGAGTIEDNDLRNNPKGASLISSDSKPNVKWARNQE